MVKSSVHKAMDERGLIGKLKSANTILRDSQTNVLERYAAVSELTFPPLTVKKAGVLTLGLLDNNSQIRALAARALANTGLKDTSNAVVELLERGQEAFFDSQEGGKLFIDLLEKLKSLLRNGKKSPLIDGEYVDYERRHVFIILERLAQWMQRSEDEIGNAGERYPLKHLLMGEDNQEIPKLIQTTLYESKDIFCRRGAIRVLGKVGLDLHKDDCTFTFHLIREVIDREENRNDYMVTWDGLQALTALVQQYPEKAELFYQEVRSIFNHRTYKLNERELEEAHRYYTRRQCIDALGTLNAYEQLKMLIEDGNQGQYPFLPMKHDIHGIDSKPMIAKRAITNAKLAIIDAVRRMYLKESMLSSDQLTARQQDILELVRDWIGSKDNRVRQRSVDFFSGLPQVTLVASTLLENISKFDADIAQYVNASSKSDQLNHLLETRRQFAVALGKLCAWKAPSYSSSSSSREVSEQIPAQEASQDVVSVEIRDRLIMLLRGWSFPLFSSGHPMREEKSLRQARLEALWTLYDLTLTSMSATGFAVTGLSLDDVTQLLQGEQYLPIQTILHLFRSRLADNQVQELRDISQNKIYQPQTRACAEIELLIRQYGDDISEELHRHLSEWLGKATGIHQSLAVRFMPVLAKMKGEKVTESISDLLIDLKLSRDLMIALRESLIGDQCYKHRNLLSQMLLQNTFRRNIELARIRLRLDYLNLYRAGVFSPKTPKEDLEIQQEQLSEVEKRVLVALQDIRVSFDKPRDLVVLSHEQTECVVALEQLSPDTSTTLLYTYLPTEEQKQEKAVVKGYLHTETFVVNSLFLDHGMTDKEIVLKLRNTIKIPPIELSSTQIHFLEVQIPIVGKIIDVEDNGVYVDVGLWRYQPFVAKEALLGTQYQMESLEEWRNYADDLVGSRLLFSIREITFSREGENIENMVLFRNIANDDFIKDLLKASPDKSIQAKIQHVDIDKRHVVFHAYGQDIIVPLKYLSWRNRTPWVTKEWSKWFEDRKGQVLELRYVHNHWSLRHDDASIENFVKLFYKQSAGQIRLTYVGEQEHGYIFETEPGQNCYVPAERLIEWQTDEHDFRFLIPLKSESKKLEPGYELLVRFGERTIGNEQFIALNVERKLEGEEKKWSKGMRIEGDLVDVNSTNGTGYLKPVDEELDSFIITISGLPINDPSVPLDERPRINGLLSDIDLYIRRMRVNYVMPKPEELQVGHHYPCEVTTAPTDWSYSLQIAYAYLKGDLRESDLTYGHAPILHQYHKGYKFRDNPPFEVMPRLISTPTWKDLPEKPALLPKTEEIIAQMGLREENSVSGSIVSKTREGFQILTENDSAFSFTFQDFTLSSGTIPTLYPGNRVTFSRDPRKDTITLVVQSASGRFSLLPNLVNNAEWQKLEQIFLEERRRKCIFLSRTGEALLFEAAPGVVFALPLSAILQSRGEPSEIGEEWNLVIQQGQPYARVRQLRGGPPKNYPVCTGDSLILMYQPDDGGMQLLGYEPGWLHYAAQPWLFAQPSVAVVDKNTRIPLIGQILPFNISPDSKMVELRYLIVNNRKIPLRHGIQGIYKVQKMSTLERQKFENGTLERGEEVQVILDKPPEMKGSKLTLFLKTASSTERADVQTLQEKLRELNERKEYDTFEGTLEYYDSKKRAFKVTLEDLEDYPEYRCWLSTDLVSYNLTRSYRHLREFGDNVPDSFTIVNINIYTAEIQVSLIDNLRFSIQSAAEQKSWSNGQRLTSAAFIKQDQNNAANDEEEGEETDTLPPTGNEKWLEIELLPGFIIRDTRKRLVGQNFHPEQGDGIILEVIEQNGVFSLRVLKIIRARLNLLYDKQRVVSGRAKDIEDGKLRLEIQKYAGYTDISCFAALDTVNERERERLLKYDLFRVVDCDRQKRCLYFTGIRPEELKEGDLLNVMYQGTTSQGIMVTYGLHQTHNGFVYRSDISYKPDFSVNDLLPEVEKSVFGAKVIENDPSDADHRIRFSIREAAAEHVNYFFEHKEKFQKSNFSTVLARKGGQWIDIEVTPGAIVRVPRWKIQFPQEQQHLRQELEKATIGDELEFQLFVREREEEPYLRLVRVVKSFLHQFKPNMLVHAQLRYRANKDRTGKDIWRFILPEYSDHEAVLLADLDFFPDVLRDDLYLVVQQPPRHPTAQVPLRQRQRGDRQFIVRIESIGASGIAVRRENGYSGWIPVHYATFRTMNVVKYLQGSLMTGTTVVASFVMHNQQPPVISLLENEAIPLARLPYYRLGQSEKTELTYVRTEGDSHIFEVQPGLLTRISKSAIYFYDQPMTNIVERFFMGDVFTVTIEGHKEDIRLRVQDISFSIFHTWQRFQRIQVEVKESVKGGLIIKASSANIEDGFIPEGNLIERSAGAFEEGNTLWLEVKELNPIDKYERVRFQEVAPPSIAGLQKVEAGSRGRTLIVFGKKEAAYKKEYVVLEVLDQRVKVPLPFLSWFKADNVNEVLPHDEVGVWVVLYFGERELQANPRQFQFPRMNRHLQDGSVVQAKVIAILNDMQGKPKSALLSMAGIFLPVPNTDIVWGFPENLPSVKEGMWLPVRIRKDPKDAQQRLLIASVREVSSALKDRSNGKSFKAIVRYTLPHGLVFSYQNAFGYIPNDALTWSTHAVAEELFKAGDQVDVYKRTDAQQRMYFSLKHEAQLAFLKKEEEVEAIVYSKTIEGISIKIVGFASNTILAFVPKHATSTQQWEKLAVGGSLILQIEEVDKRLLLSFYPLDDAIEIVEEAPNTNVLEHVWKKHDTAYLTTVRQFLRKIARDNKDEMLTSLSGPITNADSGSNRGNNPLRTPSVTRDESEDVADEKRLSELKRFTDLLNKSHIPCTYRNMRNLLGWLWENTSGAFWERLARFANTKPWGASKKEHPITYVLYGVACTLTGNIMPDLPTEGDLDDLDVVMAYAVGITIFFEKTHQQMGFDFDERDSLDFLLNAYSYQKSLEIEIALLLVEERLFSFKARNALLVNIVYRFARNSGWLLKLPKPAEIDIEASPFKKGDDVLGLNQKIEVIKTRVERILHTSFDAGEIKDAERQLEELWKRTQINEEEVLPELSYNLALCRTLQGDAEGAFRYLRRTKKALPEERSFYTTFRQSYYQLMAYLYYHSGKFQDLQDFLTARYPVDSGSWLQTWLGYTFLAIGKLKLSNEIIEEAESTSLEGLLLRSYWQALERPSEPLGTFRKLQEIMFQGLDEQGGSWELPELNVYFFPNPLRMDKHRMVEAAQKYNIPDYTLKMYEEDSNQATWRSFKHQLADLALRKADLDKAQELLSVDVQNYLANNGRDIIERWLKSSYNWELLGKNAATLLAGSQKLANLYWREPVLRTQLWEIFDRSQDYVSLISLLGQLPGDLDEDALEEIVAHLVYAGLHGHALDIVESRTSNITSNSSRQPTLARLLQELQEINEQEQRQA